MTLRHGIRTIERFTGADRKTIRRYVNAAQQAGLSREAGSATISEELIGQIVDAVRPARPGGHGKSWELLEKHREFLQERVSKDLTLVKIGEQLTRHKKVQVPYPTLRRFCITELGWRKHTRSTVSITDCQPGTEVQVDFGKLGLIPDPSSGRKRMVKALIFTSVYSRHMFVSLTFRETMQSVIEGFEKAWAFFGGTFKVVIPTTSKRSSTRPTT